jgi:hypothetical protein
MSPRPLSSILLLVMKNSTTGGIMEAIYTAPLAQRRSVTDTARSAVASLSSFLVDVLKGGIKGDDFTSAFSSAPGAQFAALPDGSKQRMLDRGFRS